MTTASLRTRVTGAPVGADQPIPAAALTRRVRPLRHPWQWVATGVVVLLALNFGQTLFTNPSWEWNRVGHWFASPAVLTGLTLTLEATAISAVVSFAGGIVVALWVLCGAGTRIFP